MPEKDHRDDRYHDALFQKFFAQGVDRTVNQRASIVGWHNMNAWGQRGPQFFNLLLNAVDDLERILAVAHNDNPANYFTLTIEFGDTVSKVRSEVNFAHIFDVDGNAVLDLKNDLF